MRRATRKISLDANHKEICSALRARGVEVVEIMQPVDAVCCWRGFVGFVEIKVPGSRANYTRPQLEFIAGTRAPVCIAKDAEGAMRFLETGEGLTRRQKDALAAFLAAAPGKLFHPAAIERVLAG